MSLANGIFKIINYKNIRCVLGILSTLLLIPINVYSHSVFDPKYPNIFSFTERSHVFIVGGGYCQGGSQTRKCWDTEGFQEGQDSSVASCNRAIQDRFGEDNAKVVTRIPCQQVKIEANRLSHTPYTSFVIGMACHIDTKFEVNDATGDEGLNKMFFGSLQKNPTCLCPDGTTKVTNGFGRIVGCKEKPKTPPLCCEKSGNPINTITGNKQQTETDYSSSNVSMFLFRRISSSDFTYWENTKDPSQLAPMGKTWRHNYSAKIEGIITTLNGVPTLTDASVTRSDGRRFHYTLVNSVWESDADIKDKLTSLLDINNNLTSWQLITTDNQTELYDTEGKLLSITLLNGQTVTLEYDVILANGGDDDPSTLDRVTDPFGRTLTLTNTNGRIALMTDPVGEIYTYAYDVNDNLISLTYPDETPLDSNDNPDRIYHYENINFPNHLTGITDENGNRLATWAYDTKGRAILSEHAGGVGRVELVYNTNNTTTVTQSTGQVQTYHTANILGVKNVTQIDGGPCTNCGSQTLSKTYDTNGFVASRTDFNGNKTMFINDARGLQTSRTEAVGTAEERTITTAWHPTFRLPTKITEPGKITNFTYDTQGRLLERREQIAP